MLQTVRRYGLMLIVRPIARRATRKPVLIMLRAW